MKTIVKYMLAMTIFLGTSCIKENFGNEEPCNCEEQEVTLRLAMPYVSPKNPTTRAIGEEEENAVENLYALAFRVHDNGEETFQYMAQARMTDNSDPESASQSFSVRLRVQNYSQRIVLVSNAQSQIKALVASRADGWVNQEKEAMLKNLVVAGDWNATSPQNYAKIPMWSESEPIVVSGRTLEISDGPIPMLRMTAKIEVQLGENARRNFKLKSVHVYNANSAGRIVPVSANIDETLKALHPSLPESFSVRPPMRFADFSAPGEPDVAMLGAIYVFETAARNKTDLNGDASQEMCIVVGGTYGAEEIPTFYRIDFLSRDGSQRIDILRNFRYACNIAEVNGAGHPTVEEAFAEKSYNMVAEVKQWDVSEITHIVFDNHHTLGADKNAFAFDRAARTTASADNKLSILTDAPAGWKAEAYADASRTRPSDWLSLNQKFGAAETVAKISLIAAENTGAERSAYISVTAGNLKFGITVKQGMK